MVVSQSMHLLINEIYRPSEELCKFFAKLVNVSQNLLLLNPSSYPLAIKLTFMGTVGNKRGYLSYTQALPQERHP